jgi:hypothetical protein
MREWLERPVMVWLTNSLRVERLALQAAELYASEGVPFRLLKGPAIARLAYDDPAERVFADLDLLVPAAHLDRAVALAVERLGGIVPTPEPRPGFAREFGKEVLVRVGGIELDLHRTLVAGPFAHHLGVDELFVDHSGVEVGGQVLPALGSSSLALHACCHAALGDYPVRLGALADLVRLSEAPAWSAGAVIATATSWRMRAVVQRAAHLAVALLDLPSEHPLQPLTGLDVPRVERLLLRSYLSPGRGYTRELAALATRPGLRARARLARALLWPTDEYLLARGTRRGAFARRSWQMLTGGGRG